jgi:(E)-4-hydroxy-3-methylbut-2-enyl-diphosphate synthase
MSTRKFELLNIQMPNTQEIERIRERFTPLVKICKDAERQCGSGLTTVLCDRIMSRHGDTPRRLKVMELRHSTR